MFDKRGKILWCWTGEVFFEGCPSLYSLIWGFLYRVFEFDDDLKKLIGN
jgi:hypothetical protein